MFIDLKLYLYKNILLVKPQSYVDVFIENIFNGNLLF